MTLCPFYTLDARNRKLPCELERGHAGQHRWPVAVPKDARTPATLEEAKHAIATALHSSCDCGKTWRSCAVTAFESFAERTSQILSALAREGMWPCHV